MAYTGWGCRSAGDDLDELGGYPAIINEKEKVGRLASLREGLRRSCCPPKQPHHYWVAALKVASGRNLEKEAWVVTALSYLHHPLRQSISLKYLPESLNLLAEIKQTGDILFLAELAGGYV